MILKRTYEQILDSMKNAYFCECGKRADDSSDTVRIFEILASELFSLSCYGDYIFRQSFVQTATGKCLDMLGELRGCERKTASAAHGVLTFAVTEAPQTDIIIPEGTVCSVYEKPYMQYATTEKTVIKAGSLSADARASSLSYGDAYNVASDFISVMVNAPAGVAAVNNKNEFSGGCDEESDSALRARIIRHYNILPNGLNITSYENQVLTLDFVTDCRIPAADTANQIKIYVSTKDGSLTPQQTAQIKSKVTISDVTGSSRSVILASRKDFSLTVQVNAMAGFESEIIKSIITERLKSIAAGARIGNCLSIGIMTKALMDIDGIRDFGIYSPDAKGNEIYCEVGEILHLNDLTVRCFYE